MSRPAALMLLVVLLVVDALAIGAAVAARGALTGAILVAIMATAAIASLVILVGEPWLLERREARRWTEIGWTDQEGVYLSPNEKQADVDA